MRTNITIIVLVLLLCASALAQSQEVLHHFSETDGERPRGTLLKFNGYIYGVTAQGGEYGHGTIYRIKPQGGEFEVIHDFDDANGNYPNYGGVITDGRYLYGLTSRGGQMMMEFSLE